MKLISELKDKYIGQTLWVVGSGPSLPALRNVCFGKGPVIAINMAIVTIEKLHLTNPVYSMQKDVAFVKSKYPILSHAKESAKNGDFGDYIFDNEVDFGIPWHNPSVVSCIPLAVLLGCSNIKYLCCDSVLYGDIRRFDGTKTYLPGNGTDYLYHGPLVVEVAAKLHMPVKWVKI